MYRRMLIVLLVGINLALLVGIILTAYSPQRAFAQELVGSGDYLMVSAEAELKNDVLYLIDVADHRLHAIRSNLPIENGPLRMIPMHTRDLRLDFPKRSARTDQMGEQPESSRQPQRSTRGGRR